MGLIDRLNWCVHEIRRLSRKVDGFSAPGLTNARDAMSIGDSAKSRPSIPSTPANPTVILKVTGTATMKGIYSVSIGTRNDTLIDPTAATFLDIDALYTFSGGVWFANQEEDELNQTHAYGVGTLMIGELWGVTVADIPIYRGHPLSLNACV